MWTRIKCLLPGQWARRRLAAAAVAAGLLVLAFCCGRWGATPEVIAQTGPGSPGVMPLHPAMQGGTDQGRKPVAYIFNSIAITREELGEYLIARFGEERIEFLVNRRIIEQACLAKGITVSDAEVEAQLVEDLKTMKVNLNEFVEKILRRFNKSLYEYKEDVIRPKLALTKYCRDNVRVTQEDLQKAFEAHYGPKVQCKMIVLPKEMSKANKDEIWSKIHDPAMFDKYAREQFIRELAAAGGDVPPIHKHFGDQRIEEVAFKLEKDEVSQLFGMPDGTFVILKCVAHLPPDTTHRLEDERMKLHQEVFDIKLAQEIPMVFQKLREQATPEIFLKKDQAQAALEQQRANELLRKALADEQSKTPQQPGRLPQAGMSPQQPTPGIQPAGGPVPNQPAGSGVQQTGTTAPGQPRPSDSPPEALTLPIGRP